MKDQLLHWAFLLVAGLALVSCGGDDAGDDTPTPPTPPTPPSPSQKWSVTVNAGIETTRGLSLDGSTLSVSWQTSETVYAYYEGSLVGVLHPSANSDNGSVTLTGDFDTAGYTVGGSFTLKFPRQTTDYTGQAGTIEDIAEKYDYLEATPSITAINADTRTLTVSTASFSSQQAIVKLTFDQALQSGDVITVTGVPDDAAVTITPGSNIAAGSPVYVALPLSSGGSFYTFGFVVTRSGVDVMDGVLANKPLQNNRYYGATVPLSDVVNISSATFSHIGKVIGANGKIYCTVANAGVNSSAVALIAYVGTAGDVETSTSVDANASTYKGLALALTDCSRSNTGSGNWTGTGATQPWCDQDHSDEGAMVTCTTQQTTDIATARGWKNGIGLTSELRSHASHNHWVAKAAAGYSVSRPGNTSVWFLPSIGQWQLMLQGLIAKIDNLSEPYSGTIPRYSGEGSGDPKMLSTYFNPVFTNAGATGLRSSNYWSCSEYSSRYTWRVYFDYGRANYSGKWNNYYVRSAFAF